MFGKFSAEIEQRERACVRPNGERYGSIYTAEIAYEWRKWTEETPAIPMRDGWMMRPVPPIHVGVSRFQIEDEHGGWVSVYLDAYDRAGGVGEPYWEVYPINGDCRRHMMADVKELADTIAEALSEQRIAKAAK